MEEDTFVIQFAVGAPPPRFVSAGPELTTVALGGSATLRTRTLGSGVTYRWERNGVVIPGATSSALSLTNLTAADISAIYRVTATNTSGSISSGDLRLLAHAGQTASNIVNLSVRTTSGAGDNMLIVGFTIAGGQTSSANMLLRGIGPSLLPFGVVNALPDPRLALFSGASLIAVSEDWGSDATISSTASRVGAFPLPPSSRDAALVQQLERGSFTVQISDARSTGVALAEIYHAGTEVAGAPRLVNLSARAASGTGSNALVAGFVLTGGSPRLLLIRAAGPALRTFGVGNALADPRLIIRNGTDAVALNNYWSDFNQPHDVAEVARSVGAFPFPSGSKDAALVVSLNPGAYTAEVSSVDGTTGIALIEVYELAP
jgi:hypothetical protein